MAVTDWNDPKDSPLVRHVLYTNDCVALLSAVISGLLYRARPERVKAALELILEGWDERVRQGREMADLMARSKGELSGWEDP